MSQRKGSKGLRNAYSPIGGNSDLIGAVNVNKMYCYVGDLLGFKELLLNLPPKEQAARVEEWIKLAGGRC